MGEDLKVDLFALGILFKAHSFQTIFKNNKKILLCQFTFTSLNEMNLNCFLYLRIICTCFRLHT